MIMEIILYIALILTGYMLGIISMLPWDRERLELKESTEENFPTYSHLRNRARIRNVDINSSTFDRYSHSPEKIFDSKVVDEKVVVSKIDEE